LEAIPSPKLPTQKVPNSPSKLSNKDLPKAMPIAPQKITYFLVLDASSSMDASWDSIKGNVNRHLIQLSKWKDLNQNRVLEIRLATFNQDFLLQEPSSDFKKLKSVLEKIKPDGKSALFDALGEVLQKIQGEQNQEAPHSRSWLLCFFTDGIDNSSQKFTALQVNEMLGALDALSSTHPFKGLVLGALPRGVKDIDCLDLDESSSEFSFELKLSFSYLEQVIRQIFSLG
jgi:Mg-chelatase subunit ChlD